MPQITGSICREAELRKNYIKENISTVYFGGGTPSLLSIENLKLIIKQISFLFKIETDAEITLEANPDDINKEKLIAWNLLGINRLSIGAQSFFNKDLQWMNRAHTAKQAYKSVETALQNGFGNISIDFIYGTPYLTDEDWLHNLERAKQLNVPHLSCYALTVEPNTALQKMIALHKKQDIDIEKQSRQFELLMHWADKSGYEHYEISNFAKPGCRSKHNSSYWQNKPYLGLGPSAHSYNQTSRQWNIANNSLYIKSINENIVPFEKEELTSTQMLNEYIMTALRTIEGIEFSHLKKLAEEKTISTLIDNAQKFIQQDLMAKKNGSLILTKKGKLFADGIAADLFEI